MADADTAEVKLGDDLITLHRPRSVALRMDVWAAYSDSNIRAFVAALAICWRSPGRPKSKIKAAQYNIAEFGGMVAEELTERGYTVDQLYIAGAQAWRLCCDGLTTAAEVDEAENFTEDQAETSAG